MASQTLPRITEEEYLRLDRSAEYKSEFVDGEMFAMSGGSARHSKVGMNWGAELTFKLRGRACSVFSSDARVRTVRGNYVYPDISVVCGPALLHGDTDDLITNPILVVEVLSPSTSAFDRGRKFEIYREIASLQEYVLSHLTTPHVEVFTRQADQSWIFREYREIESSVTLTSIGCTLALSDVYARAFDLRVNSDDE